jgi:hypothetical protein
MKNLSELKNIENDFIRSHGGILNITEFDQKQNTISRNKIRAFKSEYGTCFLGKINRFEGLKEYTGGMVYNFEYDFCIPEYDNKLVEMIENYNNPKPLNSKVIMNEINHIFNRIEKLNGITFRWV